MRSVKLFLVFCATLATSSVDAAWYQKTDNTIVDPIQSVNGGDLSYSGNDLQPYADLTNADLRYADLDRAKLRETDLTSANLEGANLFRAVLGFADLIDADLTNADLRYADLVWADLSGADLSGSDFTDTLYYGYATWTDAYYYTDNEPTWAIGMTPSWRTSEGILALSVPEPASLLLALFGLALLPRRRRR